MARTAATLVFLLTGTTTATWAARVPAIQHDLELSAFATSINDVAMNVQGVELERRARRPLLSGLHAGHSFGVLAGGLGGTAAAAAGLGVGVHFTIVAALGAALGQLAT